MTSSPDRQAALLDAEDWRFHAIGPFNTGLGMLATTEHLSVQPKGVVGFGLPSAPALYLNLASQAHQRRANVDLDAAFVVHPSPQGRWPEDHTSLFDYLQEFAAEVIFSFTALEAFANECIPAGFSYDLKNAKSEATTITGSEIERRVSLDEKLKCVLPAAHNIPNPAGTKAWQGFRHLKQVRDRLVHLKTVDRKASGPEDQTIWGLALNERRTNFAVEAYTVLGGFPALVDSRRWYRLAGKMLSSTN